MKDSSIEWTKNTFNPWLGCARVSPGCANCYAESRDQRFSGGIHWGRGAPRHRTSTWSQPRTWNRAAAREEASRPGPVVRGNRPKVFCASLSDWLDAEVPAEWLADLLVLVVETPFLNWQLLTKRPANFRSRLEAARPLIADEAARARVGDWLDGKPPGNVWLGTTVEDQVRADERIPILCGLPAVVRFLSVEPLLGPVDLATSPAGRRPEIHWVIVGGESGHGARLMAAAWVRALRDQAAEMEIPLFFKQWGCHDELGRPCSKKEGGRVLDGRTHDAWPRGFEPSEPAG